MAFVNGVKHCCKVNFGTVSSLGRVCCIFASVLTLMHSKCKVFSAEVCDLNTAPVGFRGNKRRPLLASLFLTVATESIKKKHGKAHSEEVLCHLGYYSDVANHINIINKAILCGS